MSSHDWRMRKECEYYVRGVRHGRAWWTCVADEETGVAASRQGDTEV